MPKIVKEEFELDFLRIVLALSVFWVCLNFTENFNGFMGNFVLLSKTTLKIFISFLFIFIFAFIGNKLKNSRIFIVWVQMIGLFMAYFWIQKLIFNYLK